MSIEEEVLGRLFDIPKEKRIQVGDYIKKIREEKNKTLSLLAEESSLNIADLHKIEHGTKNKINPFQFKAIAKVLEVDYKIFYEMVGFLDEKDFNTNSLNAGNEYINYRNKNDIIKSIKELNNNLNIEEFNDFFNFLLSCSLDEIKEIISYSNYLELKAKTVK